MVSSMEKVDMATVKIVDTMVANEDRGLTRDTVKIQWMRWRQSASFWLETDG